MLFFDEPLTPEESYVVTVKNLENVSGYAMSETYNLNFKTGRAETKAALKQVTRNSEVITKASELVPGSDATVEIDYQNASGKAVTLHLIVVFYNGDEMLKANYITKDVPADVKMATYKVNYTLPSSGEVTGYDSVKVMLWDGFSTMKPLSESIYLTD